jgi:Zn finger protein HypA/HybF involved in hydrogenase expression
MTKPLKYTIEQLKEAISTSFSYREVMRKLNIIPAGGNYQSLKNIIKTNNLTSMLSHFTHSCWNKGKKFPTTRTTLDEYLNNKKTITSHKLRILLIKFNIKEYKCENCNLSEWLGQPISLELDHIDGNHNNNLLKNLKILCPNCHAQTPNYRGKNKK